jgi:hypothetical protein
VIVGYNAAIGCDEEAGTFADDHTLRLLAVGKKNLKDVQMRGAHITHEIDALIGGVGSIMRIEIKLDLGDTGVTPRSRCWNEYHRNHRSVVRGRLSLREG